MLDQSDKRKHFFILSALFLLTNLVLYQKLGVKIANDSFRYLEYSDEILRTGLFYKKHDFWYLSYVIFITLSKLISREYWFIILLQTLLSGLSVVALYKSSILIFRKESVAFITSIFHILFLEIGSWNFYVLTESFYVSMACFNIYWVTKSYLNPTKKNIMLCAVISLVTFFAKPTGISFLIAIIMLIVIYHKEKVLELKSSIVTGILIASIFVLYIGLNMMLQTFILIENYTKGEIVYGITSLPNNPHLRSLTIETSNIELHIPSKNHPPILRVSLFFIQNPLFMAKLTISKLIYFLAHVKPYFSFLHNIFIVLFLYPVYYFSILSFKRKNIHSPLMAYFITIIAINCIIVSLTSEDWDGRFIMPILPVFFLLAAPEITSLLSKLTKAATK